MTSRTRAFVAEKGSGLDAIGHHRVTRARKRLDPFDRDAVGSGALDARAHRDQHGRQIDDLGLPRRVLDDRLALGERCRHHQVFGAGHGHHVGDDARALQAPAFPIDARDHVALLDRDGRAHRLQALDVLIDRPLPDRATARQRYMRFAEAGQHRAEHQDRRAHRLDEVVGGFERGNRIGAQRDPVLAALDRHAHAFEQLKHGADVAQVRHVQNFQRLARQQARREDR